MMDTGEFVAAVNLKYAGQGLPPLDARDLTELARDNITGEEPVPRDVRSRGVLEFLQRKQARLRSLEPERVCSSCQTRFVPATQPDLYLYSELVAPPPEGYCPACLSKILEQLASREGAENMRCCR